MRKMVLSRVNKHEQIVHDEVVEARTNQFWKFYKVITDLNIIKHTYMNIQYSDIIVLDDKRNILYVEKVVTKSSITKYERNKYWAKFSKLDYSFNLVVPKSYVDQTKELIRDLRINKLYYYEFTVFGIRFRHVIKTLNTERNFNSRTRIFTRI